jgi:hypothetical protein
MHRLGVKNAGNNGGELTVLFASDIFQNGAELIFCWTYASWALPIRELLPLIWLVSPATFGCSSLACRKMLTPDSGLKHCMLCLFDENYREAVQTCSWKRIFVCLLVLSTVAEAWEFLDRRDGPLMQSFSISGINNAFCVLPTSRTSSWCSWWLCRPFIFVERKYHQKALLYLGTAYGGSEEKKIETHASVLKTIVSCFPCRDQWRMSLAFFA